MRFLFSAPLGRLMLLDEHSTLARTQSEHGRNRSHSFRFSKMHATTK